MKIKKQLLSGNRLYQIGYNVTLFGTTAILLWIGIFKFTPTEAAAIRPLIEYHPFSFWAYDMFGQQSVSNFVGIVEISLAVVLLLSIKFHSLSLYAGVGIVCTFLVTLSFLFFAPGVWRIRDGVPIADFFIVKDLAYLGFGLMLLGRSMSNDKEKHDAEMTSSY